MCGLAAAFSRRGKRAGQVVFELYKNQKGRGQRGFGYVALKDRKVVAVRRSRDEEGIKNFLMKEDADAIMFHHRLPTSTDNTLGTTHPIFVSDAELEFDYYVAHNGIISNASYLKGKHNSLGYEYRTEHTIYDTAVYIDGTVEQLDGATAKFNDSESLAIEIARYLEGLTTEIGTTGSVAFWVLRVNKDTNEADFFLYGKNYGRDLATKSNNKWLSISSETGTELKAMTLYTLDLEDLTITEDKLHIMDEAKPASTTPTYYGSQETRYGFRTSEKYKPPQESTLKFALEDKNYTYYEMKDSGHPSESFDHIWVGCAMYYVPKIYAKEREERLKAQLKPVVIQSAYPEKTIERLNELALEYAVAEEEGSEAEEMLADGQIDYNEYTKVFNKAQDDMQVAEELISCLGLPQRTVDDAMDRAMELSKSYTTF